ncbi:Adenylate cyclase type [Fasciola hepatica]|uniref:Adenylate cyclase type 9 n=1 Tax=Fasciola hepatica TaxID=6192 RepID=A0A4E0RZP9_FASHE|nr:Adenylate cyclase type [Fasciola hepatica]
MSQTSSPMSYALEFLVQYHRNMDLDVNQYGTEQYQNTSWIDFDNFRRYTVLTTADFKSYMKQIAEGILHILAFLIAVYVSFWNGLRRRFVFYRLSKSILLRNEVQTALIDKVRWIEAIMPTQVTAEYHQMQRQNEEAGNNMWVYSRAFDPVSILFADIVGFTKMSSNKSAIQIVTLLNDLFSRFDELCLTTKCEKIGTLGDCYYCVSGCPEPRPNHAQLCVEMGLGMCRIIKVFNCDHQEEVNMRVGVHTGRVNAAIIGSRRFRYDVYSYDVIVANLMESSGRPGRVHISERTYNLVKSVYNVSQGEDVQIKREERSGIAGMALTTVTMRTYFVDPRSSTMRRRHEHFGTHLKLRAVGPDRKDQIENTQLETGPDRLEVPKNFTKFGRIRSSTIGDQYMKTIGKWEIIQLENDIRQIQLLQTDPEKQIDLLNSPPLNPLVLNFLNHEIEWHYRTHSVYYKVPTYIESLKMTVLSDAMALTCAHIMITVICALEHKQSNEWTGIYAMYYISSLLVSGLLWGLILFSSTVYADQLESRLLRQIYLIVAHIYGRECLLALLSSLPTISFVIFRLAITDYQEIMDRIVLLQKLAAVCILIHGIPQSSVTWCRLICCIGCSCLIRSTYRISPGQSRFCIQADDPMIGATMTGLRYLNLLELVFYTVIVNMIGRKNERNCRLCFYVTREAEIVNDLSQRTVQQAQQFLYNIIPKYVYHELQASGHGDLASGSFSYATLVPNAGVMFACVANFFSCYYREDYKGGEGSLTLLNSIICTFDNLLNRPDMKDVEKIKTINDCYMAASGLNQAETRRNFNHRQHLVHLMEYCHLIKESLDQFNDLYIVGSENFVVKIGYNFGPVTAGIIGTTKPLYDIWGDTVNVASRMYSTGLPGEIQVAEHVITLLEDLFRFEFRGLVFVKGKGEMRTFVCHRK